MSHLSKVELEINSLDALKGACKELGLDFKADQKAFKWYGGEKECHCAIRVPGAAYEIGVVREESRFGLLWDPYSAGGLEERLGKGAGRLKQAYAVERIRREARLKGYKILEMRDSKRAVRIELTLP